MTLTRSFGHGEGDETGWPGFQVVKLPWRIGRTEAESPTVQIYLDFKLKFRVFEKHDKREIKCEHGSKALLGQISCLEDRENS